MKQENHPWIQNIQYALWQIGLGNFWQNPKSFEKKQLKRIRTTRLKDIYIQTFSNYYGTTENKNKCKIINTCQQLTCVPRAYLTQIRSGNIRNMSTRFCIDANCTLDSRCISFRYKSVEESSILSLYGRKLMNMKPVKLYIHLSRTLIRHEFLHSSDMYCLH